MAQFSRLQLAAALIEYDNDPEDFSKPFRSAQESAIFAFLSHAKDPRKVVMGYQQRRRNSVDYLGVALPSETPGVEDSSTPIPEHSTTGRASRMGGKASSVGGRKSLDQFRRQSQDLEHLTKGMFQDEYDDYGEEEEMEGPELNLASWGVDQFLHTRDEKKKRRHSRASTLNELGGSRPMSSSGIPTQPARTSVLVDRAPNRKVDVLKARSVGNWSEVGLIDEVPPERSSATFSRGRANSVADPLDIANANDLPPAQFRRGHTLQSASTSGAVPFPAMISPTSIDLPNPFELPPPAPDRSSRFDPKTVAHQRTVSFASLNSRQVLDMSDLQQERQNDFNDNVSVMTGAFQREGPARYSRIDMLRPKVLVMPAPLQDQQQVPTGPTRMIREGFADTTGARPMPPGAKTTGPRPGSMFGAGEQGVGFTPNPRSSMSLAQLTFRNTLMVGGERDVAYEDIEADLQRADEEGIQVDLGLVPDELPGPPGPSGPPRRAPGKLYGHSLMDELEARKNQLKGKQRVFRGDERPSMMQRAQPQRQSTFINPESLQQPAQTRLERPGPAPATSAGKTLLDFSKDKIPGTSGIGATLRAPGAGVRMPSSQSVFGVDEVWEREMVKVKKIEEQERKEAEARQKVEDERAARKAAKKHGKGKAADSLAPPTTSAAPDESGSELTPSAVPQALTEPPLLPSIPLASKAPVPTTPSTSDDSEDERPARRKRQARHTTRKAPVADDHAWDNSSDEEREAQKQIRARNAAGGDSDSDVPLAAAAVRARQRRQEDSEEEDQPLASVVAKKLASPPRVTGRSTASAFDLPTFAFDNPTKPAPAPAAAATDDDDDKPLALKRLTAMGVDEDDQPLGMRYSMAPSQVMLQQQAQVQAQVQAQAQVQMQQQQMMMQMAAAAQVRQTMFNPMMGMGMGGMGGMGMVNPAMSMNGLSVLGPPMGMGMNPAMAGGMQTSSLQVGSALAAVDPAKHARLDRWRREITDDD